MREIKFRAWDKSKSEMIYSGIEFELRAINYPSKYGENNAWGSDTIGFMNTNEEYFDIMRYTGLKDKNGKEAYFSDIVNAKIRDANGVVYDVIGIIGWGEFEIQLEMESDYWPVASWSLVESFEITGNIHQKL